MGKNKWVYLGALLLISILLGTISLSKGKNNPLGKWVAVENGKELYRNNCMSCHGENGEGRKIGSATALNNQEFLSSASDAFLFKTIAKGRKGTEMPAFGKTYGGALTDEEIQDIVLFLREWQTKTVNMPTPSAITGDPEQGRKLYLNNCMTCHGQTGRGKKGMGPSLVNQEFLDAASDEYIWDAIAYGRSGTPMGPSLKGLGGVRQLSKQEISAIVAYLRSFDENSKKKEEKRK